MIPARCIEIATNSGEIICDPFGGGGSTYQAAQSLQRYWLGTEITDCTPIIQRMQEHFPDQVGKPPAEKLLSVFG
jgi:site-specific DNA-methyltransferase (adenine-specific)